MLAYYLIASRCLPSGISVFWGGAAGPDFVRGVAFWLIPNMVLAGVWAALWSKHYSPWRCSVALLLTALPPIGVVGWASPFMAAGIYYPAAGWIGLLAYSVLLVALPMRIKRSWVFVAALFGLSAIANMEIAAPHQLPYAIVSIDTRFGSGRDIEGEFDRMVAIERRIRKEAKQRDPGAILVFPEAVSNQWELNGPILDGLVGEELRARKMTTLIGGQRRLPSGQIENATYAIGASTGTWINRVPVPAGLWNPFRNDSAKTDWFANGMGHVGQTKIATLICYEQVIVWPALLSALAGAEVFIAPANLWFAPDSSLGNIERQGATSLARLFAIPIVFAVNH